MKFKCKRCGDSGWVCEFHTDLLVDHDQQCRGAGAPCPICNTTEPPYPSNPRRHVSGEWIDD